MKSKHIAVLSFLLFITGCAASRHGATTRDFEGYLVPVDSRPGSFRLQVEKDYDSTLKNFVLGRGEPDYIFVVDRNQVKLVYLKAGEVAIFKRSFSSNSKVSVEKELSPDITVRLKKQARYAFMHLNQ